MLAHNLHLHFTHAPAQAWTVLSGATQMVSIGLIVIGVMGLHAASRVPVA